MKTANLKAYLANIGVSIKDFCESIDCNPCYMSQILNGKKLAGRRLAKDVLEATEGEVRLETKARKKYQKCGETQNDQQENRPI